MKISSDDNSHKDEPSLPPNLRDAFGEINKCASCEHFMSNQCDKYHWPVSPDSVCDSYKPEGIDTLDLMAPTPVSIGGGNALASIPVEAGGGMPFEGEKMSSTTSEKMSNDFTPTTTEHNTNVISKQSENLSKNLLKQAISPRWIKDRLSNAIDSGTVPARVNETLKRITRWVGKPKERPGEVRPKEPELNTRTAMGRQAKDLAANDKPIQPSPEVAQRLRNSMGVKPDTSIEFNSDPLKSQHNPVANSIITTPDISMATHELGHANVSDKILPSIKTHGGIGPFGGFTARGDSINERAANRAVRQRLPEIRKEFPEIAPSDHQQWKQQKRQQLSYDLDALDTVAAHGQQYYDLANNERPDKALETLNYNAKKRNMPGWLRRVNSQILGQATTIAADKAKTASVVDPEDTRISNQLSTWVNQDEATSQKWQQCMTNSLNNLKAQPNYNENDAKSKYQQIAKEKWLKDNPKYTADDPFGRLKFQPDAAKFIQDNSQRILSSIGNDWNKPSHSLLAWHLAQHMDHPSVQPHQQSFLNSMTDNKMNIATHPNYRQYQFLSDRNRVNQGLEQEHGTQGDRGLFGHVNPDMGPVKTSNDLSKNLLKIAKDNPYNSLCPICMEPAISSCRCRIGDHRDTNGHHWHTCPVHGCINLGSGHGQGGGCTCNSKEAAFEGIDTSPGTLNNGLTTQSTPTAVETKAKEDSSDDNVSDYNGLQRSMLRSRIERCVNVYRNGKLSKVAKSGQIVTIPNVENRGVDVSRRLIKSCVSR